MKVKINKNNFSTILARSQNIVEKRNTMPVLVNVLLEVKDNYLKIFSTDLEISLTDNIPVDVIEPGKVAVNAKNLFNIIKELPDGDILLEKQSNNWLKILKDNSEFNIVGISPDEYPVFPTYNTSNFMVLDSNFFSEMIEKTIYSVSNDETRYHLNGVYFEVKSEKNKNITYRMVATDGHRLSLIDRKGEKSVDSFSNQGVIIPRKGLHELRKLLDGVDGTFEMAIEGSQLIIKHNSTILMIRLIEGKYPNYKQLIPHNLKQKVLMNRELLVNSLKRVSLLSNQKSKGVTFKLTKGKIEVSSNNPELGDAKEQLDIDYSGDEIKIGFNAKYLLDVLNSIDEENISLEINDQSSPGLMKPSKDTDYTCVVMPMRI